ncbi:MAG: hypothetical protein ABI551_08635 [Polyangiaceae bacterium]
MSCGGALSWAANGQQAQCTRCQSLFTNQNGQLVPAGYPNAQTQPQHNIAAGTFDMGGGQQVRVQINGKSPESFLKDKASSTIWGWVIGAIFIVFFVLVVLGLGAYIFYAAKAPSPTSTAAGATAVSWNGKSTLECKGNDVMSIVGTTAIVSGTAIKASGNCQLSIVGVNITAATGIDATANAKVTMTGGSIKATTNSVVASAAAKVDCIGTTVTGKSKTSGAAKITGAN